MLFTLGSVSIRKLKIIVFHGMISINAFRRSVLLLMQSAGIIQRGNAFLLLVV